MFRGHASRVRSMAPRKPLHHVPTIDVSLRVTPHGKSSVRRPSSADHDWATPSHNHVKLTDLHRSVRGLGREPPAEWLDPAPVAPGTSVCDTAMAVPWHCSSLSAGALGRLTCLCHAGVAALPGGEPVEPPTEGCRHDV